MKRWGIAICTLLALGILPQWVSTYYLNLLTLALIFAIFAMSFDLVFGYLDLPSLGHVAFYGVAAYTVGLFSKNVTATFALNFLLGIGMACGVAALFGLLALRTRDAYFLMITLAMAQMLWAIAFKWRSFTRGDDGISAILRPEISFLPWSLRDPLVYFYFVLFFFVASFVLMSIVVRSPFGHITFGIRENELRMRALGYNTLLYKYIWLIISAFFAGLAGILAAYFNGYVGPAALGVGLSAECLLMVLLGGPATLIGPAIGAGVIVFLQNMISAWTERWLFVLGAIFVLVVLFTPEGILGLVKKIGVKKRVGA
jgi:branched-chain amino acid transport system permease protein